ncbi:hypothetical protein RHMOL_Rhmol07G0300800 [Rhododendron molle]|uniref:Uncharacterized protein n=1 Tax=Rhododendron molle TaxID=49168 RepID=A0ACC0N7H3_RHOML|nr:hypothetical protein RHMOL_Rhmol07G0300800 [Rhododendron molle]
MSVATELRSPAKPATDTRSILGPGGNRVVKVSEEARGKKEGLKKKPSSKLISETPREVLRKNSSFDSVSSSDASSIVGGGGGGGSSVKMASSKRTVKGDSNGVKKSVKVVVAGDGVGLAMGSTVVKGPVKRCDWITPHSGYNLMNKVRMAHHDLKLESNLHLYCKDKTGSLTQRIFAMNRELDDNFLLIRYGV